jgi:hypothetical protein
MRTATLIRRFETSFLAFPPKIASRWSISFGHSLRARAGLGCQLVDKGDAHAG